MWDDPFSVRLGCSCSSHLLQSPWDWVSQVTPSRPAEVLLIINIQSQVGDYIFDTCPNTSPCRPTKSSWSFQLQAYAGLLRSADISQDNKTHVYIIKIDLKMSPSQFRLKNSCWPIWVSTCFHVWWNVRDFREAQTWADCLYGEILAYVSKCSCPL